MITSIVVGFDGSEPSERALRFACDVAQKYGATLEVSHTPKDETVAFAAEAISGFYVGPSMANHEALQEAAQEVSKRAREVAEQAGRSDLTVHIGHGDPVEDLIVRAEAVRADLIVTGRRGLGDLRGLFLGSTSHEVGRRAKCACLTVP
ncbi:MAG: universal stress protein [Sulfitobacter sp.]|nr:universal stress protein [Sulfitobacter sp.]